MAKDPQLVAAERLMGEEDGIQRLWTPHRMAYLQADRTEAGDLAECPFCAGPDQEDADGLIVYRGQVCFVALNLFPYSPGHVLICPYRHVADLTDLDAEELHELAALAQQAMRVLRSVSAPDGFNLGMNQGVVAGAGVPGHLHQHVVPRWAGDANFFPIIARTKAVPQLLGDTQEMVAAAWRDLA